MLAEVFLFALVACRRAQSALIRGLLVYLAFRPANNWFSPAYIDRYSLFDMISAVEIAFSPL